MGAMSDQEDKQRRIEAARAQLRDRWRTKAHPESNRGTGPLNRHGKPKLPPGQTETTKWPILDLGRHPKVALADWRLTVDGAGEAPVTLGWEAFIAVPPAYEVTDF